MANLIDADTLAEAAIVLHDVLTRANLPHVFMGGFQLLLHGSPRGSKDIDVEINKPLFKGYEKIFNALKDHGSFLVFDGNRKDAIRAVWASTVGIDILMRPGRFPRSQAYLPVGNPDPETGLVRQLPFLTPSHLMIEKILCAGEREKSVDAQDIRFIYEVLALRRGEVDLRKVRRNLNQDDLEAALQHHSEIAYIIDAVSRA